MAYRRAEYSKRSCAYADSIETDISVSKAVQLFKGKSSFKIRKEFPSLEEFYWGKAESFWGDGFFVETVGKVNETKIREYIQNQ